MSTTTFHVGGGTMALVDALLRELGETSNDSGIRRDEVRFSVHAPLTLGVIPGRRVGSPPTEGLGLLGSLRLTAVEQPAAANAEPRAFKALYRTWCTDISKQGVGLLAEHEIPPGLDLFINLEPLTRRSCIVPCKTIYCRKLLTNTYRVGGVFLFEDESPKLRLVG